MHIMVRYIWKQVYLKGFEAPPELVFPLLLPLTAWCSTPRTVGGGNAQKLKTAANKLEEEKEEEEEQKAEEEDWWQQWSI